MRSAVSSLAVAAVLFAVSFVRADPTKNLEMFLDDVDIASKTGVTRTLNQPERRPNPVITGGGNWDAHRSYGTVIYDTTEHIYKAWYRINAGGYPVGYATSVDGLSWNYPKLGLVPYGSSGSTANNRLFESTGTGDIGAPNVTKDDAEPDPNKRYKIAYFDIGNTDSDHDGTFGELTGDGGTFTGTSPDGIHWTRTNTPAAPQLYVKQQDQSVHDVQEMIYDSQKKKYVIYSKGLDWRSNNTVANNRQIVRTESSDFVNWSTPQVVITHDGSAIDPQSYGMSVFEYQGVYVGLLRIYHDNGVAGGHVGDQSIDVQLVASRDGISWTRVANKATFMAVGAPGTWEDGMVFPFNPIVTDNQIKIYYHGWDDVHDQDGRVSTIGLATLDPGRFASMSATSSGVEGTLTTDPFAMSGGALYLNADLGNAGALRVSVLSNGVPLTGYGDLDARLTRVNDLYYDVSFAGRSLAALDGQNIALKFYVGGSAELYGYTTSRAVAVPEPAGAVAVIAASVAAMSRRRRDRL